MVNPDMFGLRSLWDCLDCPVLKGLAGELPDLSVPDISMAVLMLNNTQRSPLVMNMFNMYRMKLQKHVVC